MSESPPLLAAKLISPSPGPFHLPRPRLADRLSAGLAGRATVVLAGPGYGKTSLVARFLQDTGGDSVWYWLDASDRDPWIFFRYLIHAVKEHVPEFGERAEGLWKDLRARSEEVERLADIFISDAAESLGGRLVVVLDDVQHLDGSALCTRALKRLLAYLPGALHLILVGRSLPDLGLKALMAEDAVHLVEADDLLFTPKETRALLVETFGLPLRAEAVRNVHARTRGWVTALQLLRHTTRLEGGVPDLPDEIFARTEPSLFDYFSEEVLAAETREVRDFLLGSSVPAIIDPEICTEVLEGLDVRGILQALLKRKLFISPLESRTDYCAYDPLFRDFLSRRLRAERGVEGVRDLGRRFGRALARHGEITQALVHLVAAEDVTTTTDLLAWHGRALLRDGLLDTVSEAALFLASHGVRSRVVDDLLGEACRLAGDYAAAIMHFQKALAAAGPGTADLRGPARASTLQGLAYSLLKTGEMERAAEIAMEALKDAGSDDPALLARILNTLSIVQYRQNRHQDALAGWQEALARARQAADDHLILMIAHNLGLPHAVMGDFRRASECFRILTSPENPRAGPEEGAAYLNLARIATIRGEYGRAASLLGDAREIANKWRLQALTADVLESEGNLLRETGNLEGARERYARARRLLTELGRTDLLDGLAEEEAILASLQGHHAEARALAACSLEHSRSAGKPEGIASALITLGEVLVRSGDPEAAVEPLSESAATFTSLGHTYRQFSARLWLALASHRSKSRRRAEEAAAEALDLASRFDYRAAVLRAAGLDGGFRRLLVSMPAASAYLTEAPGRSERPPTGARLSLAGDASDLSLCLLGPIEVFRDAQRKIPVSAWKIRRALQILCYIASSRSRRAGKERITDALWDDARLSVIDKNFHPTISCLRRALNYGFTVPKNFILFEGGAYLLNPEYRYDIDIEAFEEGIRAARRKAASGKIAGALAGYDTAIALYRGPFLEDDYDEWTEAPRAHFESLRLQALAEAGRLHLGSGHREAGIACLSTLVECEPLNEEASVLLMTSFGNSGNRAAVEREFARLCRALKKELSSEPLHETRRAYLEALSPRRAAGPAKKSAPQPGRKGVVVSIARAKRESIP